MHSNTASRQAGANLRAEMARHHPKVSQASLGQHLGMSQAAVSAKLMGNTPFTIDQLAQAADFLGVPLETLTDGVAA